MIHLGNGLAKMALKYGDQVIYQLFRMGQKFSSGSRVSPVQEIELHLKFKLKVEGRKKGEKARGIILWHLILWHLKC